MKTHHLRYIFFSLSIFIMSLLALAISTNQAEETDNTFSTIAARWNTTCADGSTINYLIYDNKTSGVLITNQSFTNAVNSRVSTDDINTTTLTAGKVYWIERQCNGATYQYSNGANRLRLDTKIGKNTLLNGNTEVEKNITFNQTHLGFIKNLRGIKNIENSSLFFDGVGMGDSWFFRNSSGSNILSIRDDNITLGSSTKSVNLHINGNITNNNGDVYLTDVVNIQGGYNSSGITFRGNGDIYTYDAVVVGLPYQELVLLGLSNESWGDIVLRGGDLEIGGETNIGSQSAENAQFTMWSNVTNNQSVTVGYTIDWTFIMRKEQGNFGNVMFQGQRQFTVNNSRFAVINSSESAPTIQVNGSLVGINTAAPTNALDINDDSVRIRTAGCTPGTCIAGEVAWNITHVCVCTTANTWKTAALT